MNLFYIISKIVGYFLLPANWIIILVIIAAITKRKLLRKRLLIAAVVIFIIFSNEALFDAVANAWQPERPVIKDSAGYSAGILLGGFSQVDSKGRGYFTEAGDRFIQAIQLYHTGAIKKIVITGATYNKDLPEEGDYLVPELVKAGVRREDILPENRAVNTYENAVFSKQLLDSLHLPPPYLVITSAFHIHRSKNVFDKAGVPVIMYPAHYLSVKKKPFANELLLPNVKTLDDWRYLIKEFVGSIGYWLTRKA